MNRVRQLALIGLGAAMLVGIPAATQADGMPPWMSPIGQSIKGLAQLPPTWDKKLPANDTGDSCNSARFTCVMGGQVVRDNETGLVWEASPDFVNFRPWYAALLHCANRITGGRMGWRLPSPHELSSLVDPSVADPGPRLPVGHPFTNVQSAFYWTAAANANDSATVWGVNLREGGLGADNKSSQNLSWCVRGAGPVEAY
jgi:hypothetical protein